MTRAPADCAFNEIGPVVDDIVTPLTPDIDATLDDEITALPLDEDIDILFDADKADWLDNEVILTEPDVDDKDIAVGAFTYTPKDEEREIELAANITLADDDSTVTFLIDDTITPVAPIKLALLDRESNFNGPVADDTDTPAMPWTLVIVDDDNNTGA